MNAAPRDALSRRPRPFPQAQAVSLARVPKNRRQDFGLGFFSVWSSFLERHPVGRELRTRALFSPAPRLIL